MNSINKKKLAHSVIDEIKNMVQRGELKDGDKLPNQHEFAANLGVSRTVLREALANLVMLGVVEQRPRAGTVIKNSAGLVYTEHVTPPLIEDPQAAYELNEARSFIEVGAAGLAAERADEGQLQKMAALIEELEELAITGDTSGYTEKNAQFHLLLTEASQNRFLTHLLAAIRGYMESWTHESVTHLPGLMERSLKQHRDIFEAVKNRDREMAVQAMEDHISEFMNSLKILGEES